ncbi:MAG: hypothetical protein ACRD0U_16120, partial [Acidimicrobiales bacterium]
GGAGRRDGTGHLHRPRHCPVWVSEYAGVALADDGSPMAYPVERCPADPAPLGGRTRDAYLTHV